MWTAGFCKNHTIWKDRPYSGPNFQHSLCCGFRWWKCPLTASQSLSGFTVLWDSNWLPRTYHLLISSLPIKKSNKFIFLITSISPTSFKPFATAESRPHLPPTLHYDYSQVKASMAMTTLLINRNRVLIIIRSESHPAPNSISFLESPPTLLSSFAFLYKAGYNVKRSGLSFIRSAISGSDCRKGNWGRNQRRNNVPLCHRARVHEVYPIQLSSTNHINSNYLDRPPRKGWREKLVHWVSPIFHGSKVCPRVHECPHFSRFHKCDWKVQSVAPKQAPPCHPDDSWWEPWTCGRSWSGLSWVNLAVNEHITSASTGVSGKTKELWSWA